MAIQGTRFFDDPVIKIINWLMNREQRQMRQVIEEKYKGSIDKQVYWIIGTDLEKDGLSPDPVEQTVQRLSLSQVGVFMAQRIWARRTWIVLPVLTVMGLALSWLLIQESNTTRVAALVPVTIAIILWFALMLRFAASWFAPLVAQIFLPRTPIRQDEIDAVQGVMSRCVVRDLPADAPADLSDRLRVLVADAEGHAVTGQVLATDLEYSAVRAEWLNTQSVLHITALAVVAPALAAFATWAALAGYYASAIHHSMTAEPDAAGQQQGQQGPSWIGRAVKFVVAPMLLGTLLSHGTLAYVGSFVPASARYGEWIFVIGMWWFAWSRAVKIPPPLVIRSMMLDQAVRDSASELLIDKAGRAHFQHQEQARQIQLANAKSDSSPFLTLGTSTGLLAQRRDPLAPTEAGLPVGLSVTDLSPHLVVLGASGTGKTTGVIRPITRAWLHDNLGGLLVLDGKGALPLEMNGLHPDYTLISPTHGPFNPIEGMEPDAVADTLADVFASGDGDPFWSDSARLMLRMAAILVAEHPDLPYTLGAIQRFCLMGADARLQLLEPVAGRMDEDSRVQAAAHYWFMELPAMPEKTAGSIVNIVRTWLGNISLHKMLGPWSDSTDSPLKIESVMTGAKLGLLLPESEYGAGGVAISTLCMRRLYDAVKKRGDGWRRLDGHTPVLLAADEVQNLLTKNDLETVPVARSLGLYLMMATQNVDGLYKRLGKEGAVQMLGNFASLIALPPRTKDSNAYVSERIGNIWKASVSLYHGLPDAAADIGLYQQSGTDKMMQSVMLHRQGRYGAPRLSYSIGLWHRQWMPKAWQSLHDLVMPDQPTEQMNQRPNLALDLAALVTPDELDTLLAVPNTAIAIINRGRVQRRDVIRLGGVA